MAHGDALEAVVHLLDTEVVWALREASVGRCDPAVTDWATAQPRTGLFVSALTLAELAAGAAHIAPTDRVAAASVRQWLDGPVATAFDGRVLAIDSTVARRAGMLGYADLRDGLLAATALEHGLTLATRAPQAFRLGKVRAINPWAYRRDREAEGGDWRQAIHGPPVWLRNLFARG
ncbi:PIN domain-containing protein [Sphingomonas bacterium]|uniref:PIN domain-containing protein n=1 Tax=Sphingomonas bacterium TaxID=1895847 RepID=UPI001C2DCCF2|nr:PIN domain-containing protein [Sphingomonas bacterium]